MLEKVWVRGRESERKGRERKEGSQVRSGKSIDTDRDRGR